MASGLPASSATTTAAAAGTAASSGTGTRARRLRSGSRRGREGGSQSAGETGWPKGAPRGPAIPGRRVAGGRLTRSLQSRGESFRPGLLHIERERVRKKLVEQLGRHLRSVEPLHGIALHCHEVAPEALHLIE